MTEKVTGTWKNWWNADTIGVARGLGALALIAVLVGVLFDHVHPTPVSIGIAVFGVGLYIWAYFTKALSGVVKLLGTLIGIVIFAGFILAGCAGYIPSVKAGLGYDVHANVVGNNPTGTVVISQPLLVSKDRCVPFSYVNAEFLHISSIPDVQDKSTINQAQLMFQFPLGAIK